MEARAKGAQAFDLLPATAWGKTAVGLAIAFFPLCGLFVILLATGRPGGTTFTFTPRLIPGLLAAGCAALALATSLIGIIFRHERSLLTFVAAAFGLLVTFFVVGEFAIPPHD